MKHAWQTSVHRDIICRATFQPYEQLCEELSEDFQTRQTQGRETYHLSVFGIDGFQLTPLTLGIVGSGLEILNTKVREHYRDT